MDSSNASELSISKPKYKTMSSRLLIQQPFSTIDENAEKKNLMNKFEVDPFIANNQNTEEIISPRDTATIDAFSQEKGAETQRGMLESYS